MRSWVVVSRPVTLRPETSEEVGPAEAEGEGGEADQRRPHEVFGLAERRARHRDLEIQARHQHAHRGVEQAAVGLLGEPAEPARGDAGAGDQEDGEDRREDRPEELHVVPADPTFSGRWPGNRDRSSGGQDYPRSWGKIGAFLFRALRQSMPTVNETRARPSGSCIRQSRPGACPRGRRSAVERKCEKEKAGHPQQRASQEKAQEDTQKPHLGPRDLPPPEALAAADVEMSRLQS